MKRCVARSLQVALATFVTDLRNPMSYPPTAADGGIAQYRLVYSAKV